MYDVRFDGSTEHPETSFAASVNLEPRPRDSWLFTDPVARSVYARQRRLGQLKEDIRAYVMRNRRWAPEELEFNHELGRLLEAGLLIPKGTFGYLSPHPSVYRATHDGDLKVNGHRFHFEIGDDVVFEPWLARVSTPGLWGPLRIGRLQSFTTLCLCREAFPQVSRLCEKALAILQQTLPNGAPGHINQHW